MENKTLKVVVSIALILVLVLTFCSCGKGHLGKVWSMQKSKDEFGDVTENSVESIVGNFEGTFSNSTSSDNGLTGSISFYQKKIGHLMATFTLLEDGKIKATYTGADTMILKIKVGDAVSEYTMRGLENNSGLVLGYGAVDYGGDELFNYLYGGTDVRSVIEISSSKYTFEIKSANFGELCKENGISAAPAKMTTADAVSFLVDDKGLYVEEAFETLKENLPSMERVKSEDISKEINGNFISIFSGRTPVFDKDNNEYGFPMMLAYEFSNKGFRSAGEWDFQYDLFNMYIKGGLSAEDAKKRDFDAFESTPLCSMEIKDDMLIVTNPVKNIQTSYCFYKLTDSIYIMATVDEKTGESKTPLLLVRCGELENEALKKVFDEVYNKDIPNIK